MTYRGQFDIIIIHITWNCKINLYLNFQIRLEIESSFHQTKMVYKANKQCAPLVFHTLAFYKRSLDTRNANFENNSNKVCCHLIHAWSHKNCIDYHIRSKAKIVGDHKSNIWYVWIRSNNRWHIYVSVYIGLWLILRRGRHELTYFPIQLEE